MFILCMLFLFNFLSNREAQACENKKSRRIIVHHRAKEF